MITEQLLGENFKFDEANVPDSMSPVQRNARIRYLEELHKKNKYIHVTRCPYCGEQSFTKISEINRRALPSEIVICCSCDGCFKEKILDAEATRYYYETISSAMRDKDILREDAERLFDERVRRFATNRFKFISHFADLDPKEDLVLEFGCDDGANLTPWRDNGFRTLGVDLDMKRMEIGRGRGLDLVFGDFLTYQLSGKKARLVIVSHVLDHVIDIEKAMGKIREALAPDGYLFIEIPGIKSWSLTNAMKLFDVENNYYFDLKSLRRIIERHGFSMIYGDEYVRMICAPAYARMALTAKTLPLSLDMVKAFLCKIAVASIGANRKDLLSLLKEGEKRTLAIRFYNAAQRIYFRSFYNAF